MSPKTTKTSLTNELAKERNQEASDRTLMAWIRTSISLIGFGFAIAKSYDYLETDYMEKTGKALDTLHSPIIFGAGLMILGLLGILMGVIQYRRILNRIHSDQFTYAEPWPLPLIIAILLLIIGAVGVVLVLL